MIEDLSVVYDKVVALCNEGKTEIAVLLLSLQIEQCSTDLKRRSKLQCFKAECHQLQGDIRLALKVIDSIDVGYISEEDYYELQLMKLKMSAQTGRFNDVIAIAESLEKRASVALPKSALWRASYAYFLAGENRLGESYRQRHKDMIALDSFQNANNLIYTEAFPHFGDFASLGKKLEPVFRAGSMYLHSTVDFEGKVGNRIKSFCQSLLLCAIINYDHGNRYDGYYLVFCAGALMNSCKLTLHAEGIGELAVKMQRPMRMALEFYLRRGWDWETSKLKSLADSSIIFSALMEAEERKDNLIGYDNLSQLLDLMKYHFKNKPMEELKHMEYIDLSVFGDLIKCEPDNEHSIRKLVAFMRRQCIVPFLGAGISAWVYPLWGELLISMSDKYGVRNEVLASMSQGDYEMAADYIFDAAGEFDFLNSLEQCFAPQLMDGKTIPEHLKLIPSLWKGIVLTTNFDKAINRIYNDTLREIVPYGEYEEPEIVNAIQTNKSILVKLHGDITDKWNLVLTRQKYNEVYGDDYIDKEKTLPKVLVRALQAKNILFLGCSLSSDRTLQLLRSCVERGCEHFALIPLPDDTKNDTDPFCPNLLDESNSLKESYCERRRYLSDHRINRIWYPSGMHIDAMKLLFSGLAFNC